MLTQRRSFAIDRLQTSFISLAAAAVLLIAHIPGSLSDDTPPVSVLPSRLPIEVGTEGDAQCSSADSFGWFTWFHPNGSIIDTDYVTRIYQDGYGKLTFTVAELNDTGESYMCVLNFTFPYNCSNFDVECVRKSSNGTFVLDPVEASCDPQPCSNVTLNVQVYVMPDYFIDGMIVLGINLGLFIIFVACVIRSYVNDRKRLKKYGLKH